MKSHAVIGMPEGNEAYVFGAVQDVAVDAQRRVFVLDSRLNTVRVFDAAGSFVRSLGRPGQGPMEFQAPKALEITDGGKVLVADRYRRVKIFGVADTGFVLLRTSHVDVAPEGLCVLANRFYVQGWHHDGAVVHAYPMGSGNVVSFGAPYRSGSVLVQQQLSDGPIACALDGSAIVFMYEFVPLALVYSQSGSLLRTAQFDDYEPMKIIESPNSSGRARVIYSWERPYHTALGIVPVERDLVAVQVGWHDERSLAERAEYAVLHTYVFSLSTGAGSYVGTHVPRLGSVRLPFAYAFQNDPYPRVVVMRDSLAVGR